MNFKLKNFFSAIDDLKGCLAQDADNKHAHNYLVPSCSYLRPLCVEIQVTLKCGDGRKCTRSTSFSFFFFLFGPADLLFLTDYEGQFVMQGLALTASGSYAAGIKAQRKAVELDDDFKAFGKIRLRDVEEAGNQNQMPGR